ncbi:hypothetical protein [Terribacillus saccharophilus]|nr:MULTISPECIES: hypothetical protein [Terribacillus]
MKKLVIAIAAVVALGAGLLLSSSNEINTADNQPSAYTIINLPF